jgi:hypothetical protein
VVQFQWCATSDGGYSGGGCVKVFRFLSKYCVLLELDVAKVLHPATSWSLKHPEHAGNDMINAQHYRATQTLSIRLKEMGVSCVYLLVHASSKTSLDIQFVSICRIQQIRVLHDPIAVGIIGIPMLVKVSCIINLYCSLQTVYVTMP